MTDMEALKLVLNDTALRWEGMVAAAPGTVTMMQEAVKVTKAMVARVEKAAGNPRAVSRTAAKALMPVSGTAWTMLGVSTAHLCPETCKLLDEWAGQIDLTRKELSKAPILIGPTDYGWFVHCFEEHNPEDGVPDDLVAIVKFVREHYGVDWVHIGGEDDEIEGLPILGGPGPIEPDEI